MEKMTIPPFLPPNLTMRGAAIAKPKRAATSDTSTATGQSAPTFTPAIGMASIIAATAISKRKDRTSRTR